ncbi:5'-nucleotidase C-terminal domain-containing protein [uncultured Roseobacter sp.]|uniref:5'-nucleotidase C-terminal domain-containing protein n=1 Tax=uncultured Roseobacter sp. TaxID=114847 RepID=UPI002633B40D|nr:5'-nucleotidase C-terminal domain-containing protein [uncultured Roseobacter sp.]
MRLLATSDLHMQLIAYDYVRDCHTGAESLSRLATLIQKAREEAAETGAICLLMDNGDTLQGTPLGVHLAQHHVTPHPMVTAMNALGYDAVGIGNHDFDHGTNHLARCIKEFDAPVVCSNLTSDRLPSLLPYALLDRQTALASGDVTTLRIGVVSALPQQTATWNRHHLDDSARVTPPLSALARTVQQAKSEGADLVVALAHMGIAQFDEGDDAQNQVAEVAALAGVDAVIAGHTHLRFPGPDHEDVEGIDCEAGRIAGKPVVMPGSGACCLGVIDLSLKPDKTGTSWLVNNSTVVLRGLTPDVGEDTMIADFAQEAHQATRTNLARPVAHLSAPMHSYFALASPSPITALMAEAKRHAISRAVADTDLAALPLLAATATPATGGFEGPGNFIALPAGQLERRHVAGLIPYANQVWAVKASGARIAGWLERSSLLFNILQRDTPDQMLIDPQVPGFRFDALYGLEYKIDLTQPARFDVAGRPVEGATGRVSDITWQGQPVRPDQEFLVAVTDHRAGGGGTFRPFDDDDIMVREDAPLDRALINYLEAPDCQAVRSATPWRFAHSSGLSAILNTAPDALNHLSDIAQLRPEPCGYTQDGFVRLRLHL